MNKITKISLHGFLGVEEAEINTGKITLISGSNGTGKTSIVEAIKSAIGGGSSAKLINNKSDKAVIGIELEDKMLIKRTISEKGNYLSVSKDGFERQKPAAYINELFNFNAINPIEIINMKPKDRKELILSNIKLDYPEQEIESIKELSKAESKLTKTDVMEDLSRLHTWIFTDRTGINRVVKDKKTTVEQLKGTINNSIEDITLIESRINHFDDEKNTFLNTLERKRLALKNEADTKITEARNLANQEMIKATEEYNEEMREVERKFNIRKVTITDLLEIKITDIKDIYVPQMQAFNDARIQKLTELEAEEKRFRELRDTALLQQKTRQSINECEQEYTKYEERSKLLTLQLDKIVELKSVLLNNIPIEGIEFKDDDILIDGVSFDTLNTAKKIQTAVKIALLNEPPFLIIDGAEALDSTSFDILISELENRDTQLIITKVTNEELKIEHLAS